MSALLLILFCTISSVFTQGEQPNGMSVTATTQFTGITGTIRNIVYSNATGSDVYYMSADNVLFKVTGSITNVASRTTVFTGASATDDIIVSVMVDLVTNNLFFCTGNTRDIRRVNLLNDATTNRIYDGTTTTSTPFVQCVLDTPGTNPTGIIWIAMRTQIVSAQNIYNPTASVTARTVTGTTAGINTVTVDDTSVYWGAASGRVIKTAKSNRALSTTMTTYTVKTLSIGQVMSSAYNPNTGLLYFSSDTSLVSEIRTSTFGFLRIYPENNVQFPVIALDTTRNVLVVPAFDSVSTTSFYRVSISGEQMERFSTVSSPLSTIASVFVDSPNRMMYWGSTGGNLISLRVADCSRTCLDCSSDPDYCGFCLTSRTCTGSNTCAANSWRRVGNYECPLLTGITPSAGSTAGGTSVKIGGSFLLEGSVIDTSSVKCNIDSKVTSAIAVTFGEVTCPTPSRTQVAATASVDAFVTWNDVPWTDNQVPFQYYRCESFGSDCASCFANSECGICGGTGTCTAQSSCSQGWSTVCPTITSFSPTSASILGGTTITVTISPSIVTSVAYRCLFGTISVNGNCVNVRGCRANRLAANVISSTQISCTSPVISSGQWTTLSNGAAEVSVDLTVQPTSGSAQPIASIVKSDFLLYSCPAYESDCARCVDQFETVKRKPDCSYCFNTQACIYTADITGGCSTSGSCPFITSATPSTLHSSEVQTTVKTNLAFTGTIANVKCAWDTGNVNSIANGATAESQTVSAGLLGCTVPLGLSVGEHTVSLWTPLNATFYRRATPNLIFNIYECGIMSSCQTCHSTADRPRCEWCLETLTCQLDSDACTTSIANTNSCPAITALTLTKEVIQGGITVGVVIDYPVDTFANIDCNFNDNLSAANIVNSTFVECIVPPSNAAGTVDMYLEVGSVPLTLPTNFMYYDCAAVQGGCESCISAATPRCGWCGVSCGFGNCTDTDAPAASVCPVLTGVTPTVGFVDGGDEVVVRGGPFFIRGDFIYTCLFGTSITSATVVVDPLNEADLALKCVTPGGGFGSVKLKVFVNGLQIAPSSNLTFTFFNCDSFGAEACSDLCTAQDYCGWCVQSSSCLPQSRCESGLFLNECLTVQLQPSHVELSQPVQTIDISFTPNLQFNFTRNNETNAKRSVLAENAQLVPSPVECEWVGYLRTTGYVKDDTTVFCSTPSIVTETSVLLQVLYDGGLAVPVVQYNFVQCSIVESCTDCSKKQLCGWCLESNDCSVDFLCDSQWVAEDCPTLESIDPSVVSELGGVNITIAGRYFLDSPGMSVVFDGNVTQTPSEIVNDSLVVVAPPGVAGRNVEIKLLYNNEIYAVNTLTLGYTNDGSLTSDQVAGLAAGLVIGGCALAGVAIFLVIYLRKKNKKNRKGLFIEIKEPDYVKVAYLDDLNAHWRVNCDDGYKYLEEVIINRDRTFVQALAKVTTATELDVVGRSLIYITHANGRSAEMLQFFCNDTVRAAASENTIFRADNLATKMFKFYSKLVGSRYLYYTLVKLISELNAVAEEELRRQADKREMTLDVENSVSILNIEMEVDPTHLDPNKVVDTDASSLQLALFCQKIFSAIRTNTDRVPPELRHVFMKLDEVINERFGSQEAVHKAIGGMMFLRFICNGITNPHYYGLLEGPPNPVAQRQLILIAKLLQAVANMSQRRENTFMETMFEFVDKNIPKMKELYDDVLKPPNDRTLNEKMQMDVKVPEQVRLNSLANLHELINRTEPKLRKIFADIDDEDKSRAMLETLDSIITRYGETPEKIKRMDSKKKIKKGNSTTTSKTELLAPSSTKSNV